MNLRRFRRALLQSAAIVLLISATSSTAFAQPREKPDDGCGASNVFFDAVCEVKDEVGDVATAPVRYAANSAVDTITTWVADSAQWLLGRVINFIDDSTSPDLSAAWFTERYRFMIGLSALVLVPMLLIAAIRAVMHQDMSQLLRSFFLYLPAAVLGTFVAVFFTQALLDATDALSAAVADGIGGDVSEIFDSVGSSLSNPGTSLNPAAPSFAIFFGALLLILGSFFVWLELLVRSAAVTVSVFFLPLILAALVWPATAQWTRRLIQTLIALILSKFVVVAVISLATAALADPGGGGFGAVMGGAALMLMAAFSPLALLRLLPLAEDAAMSQLEGIGRRPLQTVGPGGSVNQAVATMRSKLAAGGRSPQTAVAGPTASTTRAGAGAGVGTAATGAVSSTARIRKEGLERGTSVDRGPTTSPTARSRTAAEHRLGGQIEPHQAPTAKDLSSEPEKRDRR